MKSKRARRGHRPARRPLSSLVAFFGLAIAAAAAAGCHRDDDRGGSPEPFYALQVLPTFEITLAPGAREALAAAPREWVHADFRYRGKTWKDVAVKLKGHRSMRKLDDKPSFKVRFDRFEKKQRFLGLHGITLNGMVEDPTLVREALGYRLYRELGVPAPDTGYARVEVDGESLGLYLLVETVDQEFLERRFGDHEGVVYEGNYGCDLYPDDVEGMELDLGDDDRPALAALAKTAAGPVSGLIGAPRARLDDSALAYLAVSAFIGDFDGYAHAHNYRLYHRPDGDRWYFVPWGIDRVFSKRTEPFDSAGLVARRCFADHDCRIAYLRTLRRVNDAFRKLHLDVGAQVLGAFVAAEAGADPRRSRDQAKETRARTRLKKYLAERSAEVDEQVACLDGDREVDRDGDGFGCMDCDDRDPAIHPGAAEIANHRDDDCSGLVDDDPAIPCPSVTVGAARFQLCDLDMTWQQAADQCVARGGALARIDSAEQSAEVYREAKRVDRRARWWIGLEDRTREGSFRWVDGGALDPAAAPWHPGQPDNGSCNQDCVALRKDGGGRWTDVHCAQPQPFVCRMP